MHAVVRVVDAFYSIGLQRTDFLRGDGAAAPAEHLDVAGSAFPQLVDHVAEVLVVPALVGRHRDGIGVFLDGRAHDVQYAAVVPQVDHLAALRLDQAAHDVDGGVVAVEQGRRRHEAQRDVGGGLLAHANF